MADTFAGVAYIPPQERWWQRHRREYWVETEIMREGTGGQIERVLMPLRCIRGRFRRLEALRLDPSDVDRAIPLPVASDGGGWKTVLEDW